MKESIAAETSPLLVEQSCSSSPSRFNRLKIQSWTTSLAHDLVGEDNSPAKTGLVRESGWGVYKRRKKLTQRERKSRENRAKKNQSKEIIHREKERKQTQHT
jgi:hypothetical protein